MVYEGDTRVELDRFRPGTSEADLWQEYVTYLGKGILLDTSGFWVTCGSTGKAEGDYRLYADKTAGEQQLRRLLAQASAAARCASCPTAGPLSQGNAAEASKLNCKSSTFAVSLF